MVSMAKLVSIVETFERVADKTLKMKGICGCDRLGFEGRIIAVFAFEGLEGMEIG